SDVTGAVIEAVTPAGDLTDSGTIAFTDVDLTDTHGINPTIVPSLGALGTLTASVTTDTTGSGLGGVVTWNYSLAASAVEYLAENETRTEQFTITLDDGHGGTIDRTIDVTITGTNDAPVVAAVLTDDANEGDTAFTADLLAGATDVDNGETATLSVASLAYAVDGGTASATPPAGISLGVDGRTLTIDPANSAFDHLAFGVQTVIVVSYDVTDAHGVTVSQTETITITGTNDVPTIAGVTSGDVTEDVAVDGTNHINATGQLTIADADTGQSNFTAQAGTAGSNGYGSFILAADGTWTYTADNTQAAIQQLGPNGTLTDSFTAVSSDGTASQLVTVTIHGTNDAAPVISTANLQTSGNGPTTVTGLSVSDADASSTEIFTITTATAAAPGSSVTPATGTGTLADINTTLGTGIVYDPGATPPQTDMVTLTVADASGATDTVNLIFNVVDPPANTAVTLGSTSGNDVLFGTGYEDQFVFVANSNHDTIIDFTAGIDHIDLSALSSIVDSSNINAFLTNNVTSLGLDDTLITLDGNDSIILRNVAYGSLDTSDFIVHV
ncbi:MAG: VCBS domain-containing protein, partial [Bradyrhizobium sp.]